MSTLRMSVITMKEIQNVELRDTIYYQYINRLTVNLNMYMYQSTINVGLNKYIQYY